MATLFTTFIYRTSTKVQVGAERFIVTKGIEGEAIETTSHVNVPENNNGQQVHEGWLGSFTEGNTTTDRYSHGLKTVLKVTPKFDWNHDLDQCEEIPFGFEITWG